jgi:MYXO-CTERM domain-containing protein
MLDCFTRRFLRFSVLLPLLAALLLRTGTASASTMIVGGNVGNQTWTPAGSPYIVSGDSTVQVGATLTIQPGVTVELVLGDVQTTGHDQDRVELTIKGTLNAVGTAASPITFKAQGSPVYYGWSGIYVESTATATISHVTMQDGNSCVVSSAPGTQLSLTNSTFQDCNSGVKINAGTPTLDNLTLAGGLDYGIIFAGTGGGTVSNTVITGASGIGIDVESGTTSSTVAVINTVVKSGTNNGIIASAPSSGTLTMSVVNSTIHANTVNGTGIGAVAYTAGSQLTMTIKNSIISQCTYGIYRNTANGGTVNLAITYSDVWGNNTNYTGTAAGVGCISQNPNYVNPPSNLALQSSSVCIDTGTSMGAPPKDILGVARPINGDGLNAAEFDMGAYEFLPAPVCGDGMMGAGEICDSGAQNGTYGHCKADCSGPGPSCGDGITNGPEACDDGNQINTDACKNDCTAAKCGDGVVSTGEECDDGNQINTDACLSTCVIAKCGDGAVQAGVEACDDGNLNNGDACTNLCVKASCGDGIVQVGVEACDDGNASNTDGCLANCMLASCGDGFVRAGVEACDDGNSIDNDGCKNDCKTPSCGDGVVQAGEACDDGNAVNTDGCLNTCVLAICGDGFVHAGIEECDDGNTVTGDGCTAQCMTESASSATGAGGGMMSSSASSASGAGGATSSSTAGAGGGASSSSASGAGGEMMSSTAGVGGGVSSSSASGAGGEMMSSASGTGGAATSSVTGAGGGGSGGTDTSGGCGCRTAVGEEGSSPSWLLVAAAIVVLRRRRSSGVGQLVKSA